MQTNQLQVNRMHFLIRTCPTDPVAVETIHVLQRLPCPVVIVTMPLSRAASSRPIRVYRLVSIVWMTVSFRTPLVWLGVGTDIYVLEMSGAHHHSLPHKQVSQLTGESDSPDAASPYSRTPALRASHKMAERKRRTEMKYLFDGLRAQIPASHGSKSSKWEILSKGKDMGLKVSHTG